MYCLGRDSAIGISSHYGLDGPGIESWWAPVQTAPEVHPTSCTLGTGSLSRGVKRSGRDVNYPPLLATHLLLLCPFMKGYRQIYLFYFDCLGAAVAQWLR